MNTATKPPAENIPGEWIEIVREIVQREGRAVKAGNKNAILIQNIQTGRWGALSLPDGGTAFARSIERDAVIERLQKPL